MAVGGPLSARYTEYQNLIRHCRLQHADQQLDARRSLQAAFLSQTL